MAYYLMVLLFVVFNNAPGGLTPICVDPRNHYCGMHKCIIIG